MRPMRNRVERYGPPEPIDWWISVVAIMLGLVICATVLASNSKDDQDGRDHYHLQGPRPSHGGL